jgi:trimeric autotransporter adhesin
VTDPSAYGSLLLSLVRDDGAVVYVNGVEVARDNMPAGPPTAATLAASTLTLRTDEKAVLPFTVPSTALVAGSNTVAVEVHQSAASSPDLSFNLQVQGVH